MSSLPTKRATRLATAAFLLLALASGHAAVAAKAPAKRHVESSPWQMAETARQQLLAMPPEQRTPSDYRTVMDVYRLVYHTHPGDVHAPDSIFNVGLLLADQGTTQHDPRLLNAAIGQLEFLRTQYPHSSLRSPALLEEGRIAVERLRDGKLARVKYSEFVDEFPKSAHLPEAQAALRQLRAGTLPLPPEQASAAKPPPPVVAALPETQDESRRGGEVAPTAIPDPASTLPPAQAGPAHSASGLAYVSGIRHWSTPTYTRVAIDLGDEVKYEAARVPHPDRIYFDLHGTKLAHELFGKVFTVTDDGFLKKIRVAQYSDSVTRIVLDVNDVTEYSAFLLPNPYRLIIDIHGGTREAAATAAPSSTASPLTGTALGSAVMRAPSEASTVANAAVEPPSVRARQPNSLGAQATSTVASVPSTRAVHTSSQHEVSSLSQQPGKQRATTSPTSQPIAVVSPEPDKSVTAETPERTDRERPRAAKRDNAATALGHVAEPTADGQRSLVRALGLKIGRIVIDPGHGGHDSGTLGVGGIMEKDVVLDVALRLGKLLHEHLGAEIIYTRSDDTFVPLETRTAIANKAEADLFVSVHANSSGDETARGVETYYLNFTSQPDALDVAARENAVSDQSVHQLADLVKKITLKDKIDESREFAADVEKSLYDGLKRGNAGLKDRGVKKAPFVVLIGANMPSILTEISFVTNSRDAAQLGTGEYRERVAESIYKGVARYTGGLSGVRVAAAGGSSDDVN